MTCTTDNSGFVGYVAMAILVVPKTSWNLSRHRFLRSAGRGSDTQRSKHSCVTYCSRATGLGDRRAEKRSDARSCQHGQGTPKGDAYRPAPR